MLYEEPEICTDRLWIITLLFCNSITAALGIIIFGLSLGTLKSDIFVYDVWQFLDPVFKIASANISCGVFMCATSAIGLYFLIRRTRLAGKLYSLILVLMFTYQLSIGVATIIISDEKTEYLRAVSIILCVDPTLKSLGNEVSGLEGGSAPRFSSTLVRDSSPLDKLYAQHDPTPGTIEECSYFVDVLTPCGSLLICGAIFYLYMLYCTVCLRDVDKRHGRKSDNIRTNWQRGVLGFVAPQELGGDGKVHIEEAVVGTSQQQFQRQQTSNGAPTEHAA